MGPIFGSLGRQQGFENLGRRPRGRQAATLAPTVEKGAVEASVLAEGPLVVGDGCEATLASTLEGA